MINLKQEKNNINLFGKIARFFTKNGIGFIIGIIATSTTAVAAATLLNGTEVLYSNTNSGLTSTNVQGAIDELSEMIKTNCPAGYNCTPKIYYEFGEPTTSSTEDYTTLGESVFVSLQGNQKSVCIIKNSKLECFTNNNYETEIIHLAEVFGMADFATGTSGCSDEDGCFDCYNEPFACYLTSDNRLYCQDYSTGKICKITSSGVVTCEYF